MSHDHQLVELCRAPNAARAHFLASTLEDAGIKAVVESSAPHDGAGKGRGGRAAGTRILVPPSDLGHARGILERASQSKSVPLG